MADALKSQMKTLSKELFDMLDNREEQIKTLKKALHSLLKEDEIMDLPSYGLLKATYSSYLDQESSITGSNTNSNFNTNSNTKSKSSDVEIYDPLYAPPKTRKKALAKSKTALAAATAATATATEEKERDDVPSYMPDFGVSLLENMDSPVNTVVTKPTIKAAVKAVVKAIPPAVKVASESINVPEGQLVYKVELQGKQYLQFKGCLYNIETYLLEGTINKDGFSIKGIEMPERKSSIRKLPDSEYYETERTVYVHVCDDIYHAVGVLTEDDQVGLWG